MRNPSTSRKRTAPQPTLQCFAPHELHGDAGTVVDGGNFVDRTDEGVVEGSGRTGLGEQPIRRAGFVCGGEELEGDLPIEHQVIGEAHLTHAPLTEAVDNSVANLRDHIRRHDADQNTPNAAVASVVAGRRNSPLAVYPCEPNAAM